MFWFLSSMSLIIDPLIFFKCLEKKTYPVSYGLVMPAPRQGSDIQNQTLLTCRHVLFQNLRMFCLLPSFTALPSHLPFLVLFNCLPPDATLEFPLVLSFSVLVCLNMSDSLRPHGLQPIRLLCPWDFTGKSTGVGCHCLLHH